MSFAVIKTGGKQYLVKPGDKLLVEKLPGEAGGELVFDQVLVVGNASANSAQVGRPLVTGASVTARIMEQGRAAKKIVFKFTHKTRYKKKKGHRQPYTKVEILKISG